jgi:hypothetical protein
MLLAKINPPAKITTQDSPFSQPTETVAEYMRVFVDRYLMGSPAARFNVSFGLLVPNGINRFEFRPIHVQSVLLEGTELDDWGTDDTVIFTKVADKIGISVTETVDLNIQNDI